MAEAEVETPQKTSPFKKILRIFKRGEKNTKPESEAGPASDPNDPIPSSDSAPGAVEAESKNDTPKQGRFFLKRKKTGSKKAGDTKPIETEPIETEPTD